MTWSILARDPATGALGLAVATKFFAVGALCLHGDGGVGAIATQALVNPTLGAGGLRLLREGAAPAGWCRHELECPRGRAMAGLTVRRRRSAISGGHMKAKGVVFLFVALLAGLAAVVLGTRWLQAKSMGDGSRIVVAAVELQLGGRVTREAIRLVDWPAGSVPAGVRCSCMATSPPWFGVGA